ncbi:MAG: thioredoxin [Dehalococcoidales bacterium]|jgi:thioredoxin 1
MVEPLAISDQQFEETVLKSEKPVLVDFWAPWCRPCLMLAPVVKELAGEYQGKIDFVKIDIDQNQKTAKQYQVMSIPTVIVFKKGKPASHFVGNKPKAELKEALDGALGK